MKTASGAGTAGAVTVVLVWLLGFKGVDMPGEVASAVTAIITAGGAAAVAVFNAHRRGGGS